MPEKISSKNKTALSAVCLSAVMLGLEITSIPSVLPTLEKTLPANFSQLQWIMNAYTLAMCTFLIAMGALADRYGRKKLFMAGIAIFGLASLFCGLATGADFLIIARLVQGMSAAGMLACQVAVLSHQFRDGPERGLAFGWWGMMFGFGLGFGPIVGGVILLLFSWHWVFLIHCILAIATLLAARAGVVESSNPNLTHHDWQGMILLPVAVFSAVYLITQGQQIGLYSMAVKLIFTLCIFSLLLFIRTELKSPSPIFDFRVFRIRGFSTALIGAGGMNFSFWPFIIYFPLYLQVIQGYSSMISGMIILAYTLPAIVLPPCSERLLQKYGAGVVIPCGLFMIAAGFVVLHCAVIFGPSGSDQALLVAGCLVAGSGLGLTNTPVTNTSTAALPPERAGMASGMEFSVRMVSLALNIAVMGIILMAGIRAELVKYVAEVSLTDLTRLVAGGNFAQAHLQGVTRSLSHQAFSHGIRWVTIYGAIAPAVLGLAARWVANKK